MRRVEHRALVAIGGEPWRVLVAQPEIDGQVVGQTVIVLDEAVPIRAGSAPPCRGIRPRGIGRIPEQVIRERHAGAGRRCRPLRHDARESVHTVVAARVGKQDVPVVHPAAELHDVAALDPREVVGDFVFAAILPFRTAIAGVAREAGVPRKVECGQAGDCRILNRLQAPHARLLLHQLDTLSLEVRRRSIFTIHAAESNFVHERRPDIRRQGQCEVESRTFEPCRPERRPRRFTVFGVAMIAVSREQAVLLVDLLVQPERHLVCGKLSDRVRDVGVVRAVRLGDVLHEELGLRRNAVLRNRVVRELRARVDAVDRRRRQRIEDRRQAAEVAAALRDRRHVAHVDDPLLSPVPFITGEEERLVPAVVHAGNHHRTAERSAELVALELLLVHREEVLRIETVVAEELERTPVKHVAARLRGHVERRAGAVELGRIRILLNAELLKRVNGGLYPGAPLVLFGDVHAVEQEAGLRARDAADDVAVDHFRTNRLRVAGGRQQRHARRETRKLVEAAPVQRQIDDLLVGDDFAERRRLGVEQRHLCGDLHFC